MKTEIWLGLILIGALSVGCSPSERVESVKAGTAKALKVGIVFDSGGRGDKSFNDSAWAGVQRAQKELGIEAPKAVDSKFEKDYETNLTALADQGCDLVVAVGLSQSNALNSVAPKYPAIKFAIVDSEVKLPNVRSLLFTEEQGSFLAGYVAAMVSKTGKLGFVGGKSMPLIEKFEAGYVAGARAANPTVQILPSKYTESWDDVTLGKQAANVLFTGGADIVYHAAGRCGLGVIAAAKEQGKYAIGVDSDQDGVEPGTVLTSMIKHVDEAVFQTIQDVKEGKFQAGTKLYDLKANGVGLSPFTYTRNKVSADVIAKVKAISARIASGEIKVPTTRKEADVFTLK